MKKLLSLLIIATIITSSLCVSYFAIDDNSTQNNTESTTVPVTETSSTVTTEPVTESSTVESSTVPTTTKPVVKVKSIKLNKSIVNLAKKGKTCTVKATVYPNNAYNKYVNWTANNKKVATVDKNGKIKATTNKGTTYVNAIAKGGSKIRTRVLVVVGEKVKKITLNKTSVTLNNNRTYKLKKSISNKNAVYKAVQWKSTNTNLAKVNSNGVVKALKRGTCYVIAVAKDGSRKSAKCKVTVRQLVTKLSYNKKTQKAEVYKNKTIKFVVTVAPSNANNKGLTYFSSNKKVATVNSKGFVKGIKAGTVTITAKAKDGSRKAVKLTVKVKNPPISDNTKLTSKQLKSESTLKRICKKFNDYFKSCGAVVEPKLKGTHQWYVENTSTYLDKEVSINDFYIQTLCLWIQELSSDTLGNDGEWNGIKDMDELDKLLHSFIYRDKNGYPKYRKNLILNKKYNGLDWFVNYYSNRCGSDQLFIYVDYEKMNGQKDIQGNQEYLIKFYYDWQSNID